MAATMGISHTSVQRIWREHGLKPHLVRGFKVSNDPDFVAKVKDVVGLYLDPPTDALVLAVDEKSPIDALDRTQPGLPLKKKPPKPFVWTAKPTATIAKYRPLARLARRGCL